MSPFYSLVIYIGSDSSSLTRSVSMGSGCDEDEWNATLASCVEFERDFENEWYDVGNRHAVKDGDDGDDDDDDDVVDDDDRDEHHPPPPSPQPPPPQLSRQPHQVAKWKGCAGVAAKAGKAKGNASKDKGNGKGQGQGNDKGRGQCTNKGKDKGKGKAKGNDKGKDLDKGQGKGKWLTYFTPAGRRITHNLSVMRCPAPASSSQASRLNRTMRRIAEGKQLGWLERQQQEFEQEQQQQQQQLGVDMDTEPDAAAG
jgi:hypothetical protein